MASSNLARADLADTSGRFVSWSHVTIHRRKERFSMVLSATGVLDGEWLITAEAGEHQLQRRRAFFFRPRPQWSTHTLELLEKQGGAHTLSPSTYRRTPGRSMDELRELAMDHEVALHLRRAAAFQVGALGTSDHRHVLRAHARSLVEMRVRDALESGLAAGQATRRGVRPVEELDALSDEVLAVHASQPPIGCSVWTDDVRRRDTPSFRKTRELFLTRQ